MSSLNPVIILAGGLATRLYPMTERIPKSLIPINKVPYINHQLRLLHHHGIREVVLCVGHLGQLIEHHVGDGSDFGLRVLYSYDGSSPLGTAGAVKKALPLVGKTFFVLYGDSYLHCDYAAIQIAYEKQQKQALMTVFHNKDQWDTSNIEFTNGKMIAYDKKLRTERMRHIDYGLGIFNQSAFVDVPNHQSFDLAVLYQNLLIKEQLAAYEVNERFYEVGSFEGIKELESYLNHHIFQGALLVDHSSSR